MRTPVSPTQRQSTTLLVTVCVAFGFLSPSCGGGSPQPVSPPATSTVSLSATNLSFGSQSVYTTSTAQTTTLTNTGTGIVSLGLALTGTNASDFAETDTCGSSVAAGAQCKVGAMFTPSA